MAERITIHKEKKPIYDIVIQNQFAPLLQEMERRGYQGRRVCIVTDSNTGARYAEVVKELAPAAFRRDGGIQPFLPERNIKIWMWCARLLYISHRV